MLALGNEVEVLDPPELRTRVAETARQIAARHASPPSRRASRDKISK